MSMSAAVTEEPGSTSAGAAECRRRVLPITGALMMGMLQAGYHPGYSVTENALPPDARVLDVRYDPALDLLEFLIESAEYEPVPVLDTLPETIPLLVRGE